MKSLRCLAIDPGNEQSAYVYVEVAPNGCVGRIIERDKIDSADVLDAIERCKPDIVLCEMIASYGMPVGKSVFDTVRWIGRYEERCDAMGISVDLVYRKEVKMALCHSMRAKDGNIAQALIDRYAPGVSNKGKGTKKSPGFFYGFKSDIWQAFAVVDAWLITHPQKARSKAA